MARARLHLLLLGAIFGLLCQQASGSLRASVDKPRHRGAQEAAVTGEAALEDTAVEMEAEMEVEVENDFEDIHRLLQTWGPKYAPDGSPWTATDTQADPPAKVDDDLRYVQSYVEDPFWAEQGLWVEFYTFFTGTWGRFPFCQW
jgi:hypothetical protein